jgi:TPR repeat protein
MYYYGEGVSQDINEAAKWFRLAAEQGYAKAEYNLGLMYDKGEGVRQDTNEAFKWYRLAAEQVSA